MRDTTEINHIGRALDGTKVVVPSKAPSSSGKPPNVFYVDNPITKTENSNNRGAGAVGGLNMIGHFASGAIQGNNVLSIGVPQWEFNGVKFFSIWEPKLTSIYRSSFNYSPQFLTFDEAFTRGYFVKIYNKYYK